MLRIASELVWRKVPQDAICLYEKSAASAKEIRSDIREAGLGTDGLLDVWYNADDDEIRINCGDWIEGELLDQWKDSLEGCCSIISITDEAGGPDRGFVSVWSKPTIGKNASIDKVAYSPMLRGIDQLLQKAPSAISDRIPGSPSPIASMVAGGMLGAGLGYGAGWLGEKILPEEWQRQRLRRSLAVLGGLAGVVPGGLWGATNLGIGRRFNDPAVFNVEVPPNRPSSYPSVSASLFGKESRSLSVGFQFEQWPEQPTQAYIPVEGAIQSLRDPRVIQQLSAPLRAVTSAVVQGAAHLNNGARFITPMDMGKVTLGMGSGYLSGLIVGKVLGALTGMPATTQNRLKSTGMWAGLLANVAPMMFPRYG